MAFPIKCGACQKSFSISDEVYNRKVRGKQVTIKCKSCGAAIRVDGTKERTVAASSAPPAKEEPAAPPPEAPPPEAPPPEAPPSAAVAPKAGELKVKPASMTTSAEGTPTGAAPKGVLGKVNKGVDAPAPGKKAPELESSAKAKLGKIALGKAAPTTSGHRGLISSPTKPTATRSLGGDSGAEPKIGKTPSPAAQPLTTSRAGGAAKSAASAAGTGVRAPPRVMPASDAGTTPRPAAARFPKPATQGVSGQLGAAAAPSPAATGTGRQSVPTFSAEDSILWAVDYGESEHRELTTEEIAREIEIGAIDGQTLVWHENMPDWLAIRDVKELRGFAEAEPSRDKQASPPLNAPPTTGKGLPSVPKAALPPPLGPLSSRSTAGAPTAPQPPSRPPPPPKKSRQEDTEHDDVVTSARLIEDGDKGRDPFADLASAPIVTGPPVVNSPLTSPAAPAAAPPAPATAPLMAAAPGQGTSVGPAGMPGLAPSLANPQAGVPQAGVPQAGVPQAGVPQASAGSTQPFPPAMVAPPTSGLGVVSATWPAAVEPNTSALPGSSSVDDLDWPQPRSKKPLVLGALGVVAVALVAWLLLSGSEGSPEPPPANTQGSPVSAPAEPAPAPPTPTPSPTPAPAADPEPGDTSGPAKPPKGGGFADMFEQGAKDSR